MSLKAMPEIPQYLRPGRVLPAIPETEAVFSKKPFLFQDFVGRGLAFLKSAQVKKMGFNYSPDRTLPSKWLCADESLFGAVLAIYGYTGIYPFDKGKIGGLFNGPSVGAAVHHGKINVDFGGAHTGYVPGGGGGSFGKIWRPLSGEYSTDCGRMMGILGPFMEVYRDACENILLFKPRGKKPRISVPNEFLHPALSSTGVKLLANVESLTLGPVAYDEKDATTRTTMGRTLFEAHPDFIKSLAPAERKRLSSEKPAAIGRSLGPEYFEIFDSDAALDEWGLPEERLLLYMKYIVSDGLAPPPLKAAVVSTTIEHNRLADTVRSAAFRKYSFACFTGIFIDMFDENAGNYVCLFQPLGLTVKPGGDAREIEIAYPELISKLKRYKPLKPAMPLEDVLGYKRPARLLDKFTFRPGHFREE